LEDIGVGRLRQTLKAFFPKARRRRDFFGHQASLLRLKQLGFEPRVIYDVGAHCGDWTKGASEVFPGAEFILFEANSDHAERLKATGRRVFIAALGSEDLPNKPFFLPKQGSSTGASFYIEDTPYYADENLITRSIPTARLDSLVRENQLPLPQLIKFDIQGAEIDAMTGAPQSLADCSALITEVALVTYNKGAPLFGDVVSRIGQSGFFCVDICEVHRWKNDCIFQMDLLFVREPLFRKFCSLGL
jgi:FkbM family methyltransferase